MHKQLPHRLHDAAHIRAILRNGGFHRLLVGDGVTLQALEIGNVLKLQAQFHSSILSFRNGTAKI